MDFDDFKKHEEARQRSRFNAFQDAFNQAMDEKGDSRRLEDIMGPPPAQDDGPSEAHQQLMEAALEISEVTGETPKTVVLRAMGLYRSIVRHWKTGGSIQFVDADGTNKTLKSKVKR